MNLEHPWSMWISSLPKIPNPKQVLVLCQHPLPCDFEDSLFVSFSAPQFFRDRKMSHHHHQRVRRDPFIDPLGCTWVNPLCSSPGSITSCSFCGCRSKWQWKTSRSAPGNFPPPNHGGNPTGFSNLKFDSFQDHPIESVGDDGIFMTIPGVTFYNTPVVRHLVKPRILTSAPGKFHKSIPPGSKRFCSAAQLPRLQKKLSKLWFSWPTNQNPIRHNLRYTSKMFILIVNYF